MQEGFVLDHSHSSRLVASWVAGKPEKSFLTGVKVRGKELIATVTFRCARCGYLESYAPEP
jgi:hypothetical protein